MFRIVYTQDFKMPISYDKIFHKFPIKFVKKKVALQPKMH